MSSNTPLIAINQLGKTYELAGITSTILNQLSLVINQGELVAIVGASGSGKSTLMNIIGLLDSYSEGEYWLKGQEVKCLTEDERAVLRNKTIGFVFQQFNLLPRFTAAQNVALPLTYRDISAAEINTRISASLKRVGMERYHHHQPMQLSGGQQQRVAIARALVTQADVILADEPTGALDSKTGADVMNCFHQLHQEGRTIIIVTHDETIANQCTRQIRLVDGRIVDVEVKSIR